MRRREEDGEVGRDGWLGVSLPRPSKYPSKKVFYVLMLALLPSFGLFGEV